MSLEDELRARFQDKGFRFVPSGNVCVDVFWGNQHLWSVRKINGKYRASDGAVWGQASDTLEGALSSQVGEVACIEFAPL